MAAKEYFEIRATLVQGDPADDARTEYIKDEFPGWTGSAIIRRLIDLAMKDEEIPPWVDEVIERIRAMVENAGN